MAGETGDGDFKATKRTRTKIHELRNPEESIPSVSGRAEALDNEVSTGQVCGHPSHTPLAI
jgi:hypothetical protein